MNNTRHKKKIKSNRGSECIKLRQKKLLNIIQFYFYEQIFRNCNLVKVRFLEKLIDIAVVVDRFGKRQIHKKLNYLYICLRT